MHMQHAVAAAGQHHAFAHVQLLLVAYNKAAEGCICNMQ
jgi:hypothetical protein